MAVEFDFEEFLLEAEESMEKTIIVLKDELSGIRVGRANPLLLEKVKVDYYGAMTPITQVANISVPEPRMLTITPWEKSMISVIEKAILTSDIGLTPSNDGKIIRLIFPELTTERRQNLVKSMAKIGEEAKIAIRQIRRTQNDTVKKLEKDSSITEDDQKDLEKSIQDLTDKYIKIIDNVMAAKEKEIMEPECTWLYPQHHGVREREREPELEGMELQRMTPPSD